MTYLCVYTETLKDGRHCAGVSLNEASLYDDFKAAIEHVAALGSGKVTLIRKCDEWEVGSGYVKIANGKPVIWDLTEFVESGFLNVLYSLTS